MSLNKKTLYDLVSQGLKQASQKGKSPIGYTVSSYKGVLNALERIKIVYKDVLVQGETQNIGTRRYSILSELGLGGQENEGFVVHGDDQMSYQAVCDIKEYMSFPTDFTNSEAKVQRIYCPVKRPSQAASQTHILNGYTLQNTAGPTFPMVTPSDSFSEDMQTALGEQSNCSVGVGISLSDLGTKFFNRFFEIEGKQWTDSFIETLASRGYLFAEVLLPFNNDTAKVLHSRVTVRHQLCSGGPFEVWLPLPLVLLDDFSALGQVSVHTTNGIEIVNQNNVKFPLRGNKYHHEESYIQNFSPSLLKAYVDGMDEDKIGYKSVNFCNQGVAKRARVRLFFSQDAKQDITKEFGALSQTHNRELFRGQANPDSLIRVEEIVAEGMVVASTATGEVTYKPGQINWDKFRANHIRGGNLSKEHADAIESVCRLYNINTRMAVAQVALETGWFDSKPYKQKNNVGGLTVPGYYVGRNGKALGSSAAIKREYPDLEERYRAYRSNYKCGQRYALPKYGNVSAKAAEKDDTRGEGNGYYWIFDNIKDGYKAWAHLVCNSQRYGINVKKPTTVGQHYNNLARGGYAESSGTYAQQLTDIYNRLGKYV